MPLWGINDASSNVVKTVAAYLNVGIGNAAQLANNTALFDNTTPGSFGANMAVGVFGVSSAEAANTTGERSKVAHAGWVLRREWQGGIGSVTANGTGTSGFANGETITASGGASNATLTITANATGNVASLTVSTGGSFPNTSIIAFAYNREKHLNNIVVGGTPTGYSNTDVISAGNGTVNATATVVTNATGGFVTANLTITGVGLWANTKANTDVAFTVVAANGAASAGSGATFTANLSSSTGGNTIPGTLVTLGGRAGRVHYETLVATGSIAGDASDDTYLPE